MQRSSRTRHAARAFALGLLLTLASLLAGCSHGSRNNVGRSDAQPAATQADGGVDATANDATKLGAEIERLEKQAERNPGDEDTRDELARAYVRRGNVERSAGQLREAIADYQSALRLDPDNTEAQNNAAATKEQFGGQPQQGENGEPAPLPITPNVADEDEHPTPTPKKQ
ncbi:MAG: Tetratricopeptide repeat [Acidobacteriota bacterium]|nr:Tetratricopeptide repeat [Acidobacteriota bacterium]